MDPTPENPIQSGRSRAEQAAGLVVWWLVCFVAAAVGGLATSQGLGTWYDNLVKPSWTPPNQLFGPVWTLLYGMMATAAWLVWRQGVVTGRRFRALAWFVLQLLLNAGWSWLFFAWRRPDAAVVEIALLWLAILATTLSFAKLSKPAGILMVPYLLWVSFAAVLNAAIAVQN